MDQEIEKTRKDQEERELKGLMVLYQTGDREAAEQLVRLLNRSLAAYLYVTSMGRVNLEDLLQECWLRIHKARASYRPGEPVMPWILAICRHVRIDYYRKWSRTSGREIEWVDVSDESKGNPQARWNESIDAHGVMRLLNDLPESQREVVVMLKFIGMSIQEIALATRSTPAAIKQKAHRAYQSIRAALGIPSKSERLGLKLAQDQELKNELS